jgi:hypothetical protein
MVWKDFFGSSIMEEEIHVRFVFVACLVLADQNGEFRATRGFLSRFANIPQELADEAIEILQKEDPESTSKEEDGRRLVSTGQNTWRVVNYVRYRRRFMEEKSKEGGRFRQMKYDVVNTLVTEDGMDRDTALGLVSDCEEALVGVSRREEALAVVRKHQPVYVDVDVSVDVPVSPKEKKKRSVRKGAIPFDDFWKHLIRKVGKKNAEKAWRNLTVKDQKAAMEALPDHLVVWSSKEIEFIPHPTTWIHQRRWEDEIEHPRQQVGASPPTNGEWVVETYRRSDMENHGNHSMWEQYTSEASDLPPRSAPPFDEWLLENMTPEG